MGDGANGSLYHAGIVNTDGKLTKRARQLFVEDVKKELVLGSEGYTPIFPCGPKIEANPHAEMLELEDEKKFPEFYSNIVDGQYAKIASQLNLAGGFMILPICDPIALAFALGVDIDADITFPEGFLEYMIPNLPKLAMMLNMMPPFKLAAKIPGLLTIPPAIPNFNIPLRPEPGLNLAPGLNLDLMFPLKFPTLMLSIIGQLPGLVTDLGNLPGAICNIVFKSGLFDVPPGATVKAVAAKVLTRKISEMLLIVATGKVIGSAPAGVTGGMGSKFGYDPPVTKKKFRETSVRDKIIAYADSCIDLEWGNKSMSSDGSSTIQEAYVQRLLYTEYGDGTRKDNLPKNDPERDTRVIGRNKAIEKASDKSSCGMLARACAFAGGAKYCFKYAGEPLINKNEKINRYYDFFTDEYRLVNGEGIAINALIQAGKAKNAIIDKPKHDLPNLKKGDIIVVYDPQRSNREHVMLVYEDYSPGSYSLTTVEGGQPDPTNKNRPTAIRKKSYLNPASYESSNKSSPLDPPYSFTVSNSGTIRFSGRQILTIIDAEKLCTNNEGSNTTNPDRSIEHDIFDSNDPTSDSNDGLLPEEG